jgi:hypothetical protein
MKHLAFLLILSGVLALVALSGCQATTDARWATTGDTVNRWETLDPHLPVEIRGGLPNASHEQIARAIPNALPQKLSAGNAAAHFVLELSNSNTLSSSDNGYCAAQVAKPEASSAAKQITMTLSLCDGTRLVARSSSPLHLNGAGVEQLGREVDRLKSMMLIGIAKNYAELTEVDG